MVCPAVFLRMESSPGVQKECIKDGCENAWLVI